MKTEYTLYNERSLLDKGQMSKGKFHRTEIADRCSKLHNSKYSYDNLPDYPKMHERVLITCPHHGTFSQRLNDHINRKAGCPECSGNKRGITGREIVEQVKRTWNNSYVPNVELEKTYLRSEKIEVVCSNHGSRLVSLNNLLFKSVGCLECQQQKSSRRFDSAAETCVYLVRISDYYKIGITSNLNNRIGAIERAIDTPITVIKTQYYDTRLEAFLHEQRALSLVNVCNVEVVKFPGHTELFTVDSEQEAIDIFNRSVYTGDRSFIELSPLHCSAYSYVKNIKNSNPDKKIFYTHEVVDKADIIRDMVTAPSRVIYARNCSIVSVDASETSAFLEKNHLQGNVNSAVNIGLRHNGELVTVMTLGKPRFNADYAWELLRLATLNGVRVVGGAGKMLKHFRSSFEGSIISYCDRRYSIGNVYHAIGFKYVRTTPPGFAYTNGDEVLSRWKAQKQNMSQWFSEYDPNQSQSENMKRAGYVKMHDAGQMVFELQ